MKVYQTINAVSAALSEYGIPKAQRNQQQGFNFRGIDAVLNSLSSTLVANGLLILPRVLERDSVERTTKQGGALFYVTVKVEFDLVCVEDGSKHTLVTYGEAMDSADKATNKAMSAAYKYLALLAFCIPTEATPETDADYTTHEVAGRGNQPKVDQAQRLQERAQWLDDQALRLESADTLEDLGEVWKAAYRVMQAENDTDAIQTLEAVKDRMKSTLQRQGAKA